MKQDVRFLIGVDGGGTSCRAAVADRALTILGRGGSGSSNITTDLDGAAANIMTAVNNAMSQAGLPPEAAAQASAVLGLAGANVGDFAARLSARLPFAMHAIDSDAVIALQGALGDGDGAIAILGTGSAYLARKADSLRLIGGWGFQLSDLGGGARLGRDALEAAILAHDRVIAPSPLTDEILASFAGQPAQIVLFAQAARPVDYGRFAPVLMTHLANGDANAVRLFKTAAASVDAAFDALCGDSADPIALLGGLSAYYPDYLAPRHKKRLMPAKSDALTGAVQLAGKLAANGSHGVESTKR